MTAATSRWSLRNIYLYVVCLITLIMVIVGVINLVRSSVEIFYPDPYTSGPYFAPDEKNPELNEKQIAEERRRAEESGRRNAILGIVSSLATVLVAGPVYLYHWRKIEGELPGKGAEGTSV